jgi:hypothetical protein
MVLVGTIGHNTNAGRRHDACRSAGTFHAQKLFHASPVITHGKDSRELIKVIFTAEAFA